MSRYSTDGPSRNPVDAKIAGNSPEDSSGTRQDVGGGV